MIFSPSLVAKGTVFVRLGADNWRSLSLRETTCR